MLTQTFALGVKPQEIMIPLTQTFYSHSLISFKFYVSISGLPTMCTLQNLMLKMENLIRKHMRGII